MAGGIQYGDRRPRIAFRTVQGIAIARDRVLPAGDDQGRLGKRHFRHARIAGELERLRNPLLLIPVVQRQRRDFGFPDPPQNVRVLNDEPVEPRQFIGIQSRSCCLVCVAA